MDAGPKGAVVAFRDNKFANPAGLVKFISEHRSAMKVQPDHRLFVKADWSDPVMRLNDVRALVRRLVEIAATEPPPGRPGGR